MTATPIRVLHVIAGLETGGAETMLATLVTQRPAGLDQSVVAMIPGGAQAERIRAAGIPLDDLGMSRGRPTLRGLLRLARLIRSGKPDIVQGWMYHADLAAMVALALSGRRRRTRLAWNLRCSDMAGDRHGAAFRAVRGAWLRLAGRADLVLANSEAGLDYHRGLGLAPAAATRLVPNGIDTDRFRPDPEARHRARAALGIAPDRPVVVNVARVDPMKDHPGLLAAMASLPEAVLLLVGKGTEALAAPPRVLGLGERRDVPALLAAADLVVCASAYGEGFSNALAEGMAAGLPAIATDVGDARLILGGTGGLCPPGSPPALAAAIGNLLREPADAHAARAAAARQRILDHYAIGRCVDRYSQIYQELAGSRAAGT
ncbi:MAG: glycosyltransferase [Rhodospirillales bacterium]|nr:glycosyltransferase [Rhodospirillales bacterium]